MVRVNVSITEHDRGYKKLKDVLKRMNGMFTEVGLFAGSTNREGEDLVKIGAIHEFGEEGLPRRPFISYAVIKHQRALNTFVKKTLNDVLDNNITPEKAMWNIGDKIEDFMLQNIDRKRMFARNADATIAKKGFNWPLVETSFMRDAITHKEGKE